MSLRLQEKIGRRPRRLASGALPAVHSHRWKDFTLNVSARLQNGLTFQGGISTGQTTGDNCEIVAKLPEVLNLTGAQASQTPGTPAHWRPAQLCHRESPMLTQVN